MFYQRKDEEEKEEDFEQRKEKGCSTPLLEQFTRATTLPQLGRSVGATIGSPTDGML